MKFPFSKKSHKEELPKALHKTLMPSGQTLEHGKKKFLAAFDTSALSRENTAGVHVDLAKSPSPFAWGLKFGIGALALVAIVAGTSAYADTANVSVNSPLYPLKRLGENVQLVLTPTSQKAEFQATLASRRASEIVQLQKTNPSSTKIDALVKDLDFDVSSSLTTASDTDLKSKSLADFCATLSTQAGLSLALHANFLNRFNARCANSIGSSTVSSTLNTSGTLNIILPPGRRRGQKGMNGSTSTTISSPQNNSSSKSKSSSWFPRISL